MSSSNGAGRLVCSTPCFSYVDSNLIIDMGGPVFVISSLPSISITSANKWVFPSLVISAQVVDNSSESKGYFDVIGTVSAIRNDMAQF